MSTDIDFSNIYIYSLDSKVPIVMVPYRCTSKKINLNTKQLYLMKEYYKDCNKYKYKISFRESQELFAKYKYIYPYNVL